VRVRLGGIPTRPGRGVALALALLTVAIHGAGVKAQTVQESRLLREAAALESRGDFDGAEDVLRRLLEARPGSSGGLFALERVLRAKGETVAVLSAVDAFLEVDPTSSGVRYLKLRVLAEVDSLDALRREAEAWFQAQPASETPYREAARVYERSFGAEAALDVLRRGRRAAGDDDALALEIGDLLIQRGQREDALAEWARAVGPSGGQAATISRRVAGLPTEVEGSGRMLVSILGGYEAVGRRRAGAQIALDLGLEREALALSRDVAAELEGRARASFLADVARRARDGELGEVASWAYAELGQGAASPAERRQFDERIAEVALAEGDTVAAIEAQRRVVESFTLGSADHRRATAQLIRLERTAASSQGLKEALDRFLGDYPEAPELDELAAAVAGALLARGDPSGANKVLEGMAGPRSSMQRGYLLLEAGEVAEGRRALLMAVAGLDPADATEVIQLVGLLGRLSPRGASILAGAGALSHKGEGGAAAARIEETLESVPEEDRAPLLAEAARMADRGADHVRAADLRARVVAEYADTPEMPEAALLLARYRGRSPGGRDEAVRLLEELLVRAPNAAVVPDARRELERLRRGT
jgi:tetratricopeptide (TPR) repeat protein